MPDRLADSAVQATVGAVAAAMLEPPITPRERAARARDERRAAMVAMLGRLEAAGHGRAAAGMVARKFASDARDPVEVDSLARSIRRWRKKKRT